MCLIMDDGGWQMPAHPSVLVNNFVRPWVIEQLGQRQQDSLMLYQVIPMNGSHRSNACQLPKLFKAHEGHYGVRPVV